MKFLLQPEKSPRIAPEMAAGSVSACAVMSAARRYLSTPFVHQGRSGKGVDCLGLLLLVARDVGALDRAGQPLLAQDATGYGWQPNGALLQARLAQALVSVAIDAMQPADIALFTLQGNPQHLAIITQLPDGRLGMLHAYAPLGKVVEHGLEGPWPRRLHAVFRLPQLA